MKVLLIEPPKGKKSIGGEDYQIFEPLALEYLAAQIKHDHDVRILDMRVKNELEPVLSEFQPDVVGITAYTVHAGIVCQLCQEIKKLDPGIFTVVGGHHATVAPEDFHTPAIDCIVIGEGVFTFGEIITRLEKRLNVGGIQGTACPDKGNLKILKKDKLDDLDSFPFPARELTRVYRKHYFCDWMRPLASIRTSKGCRFKCNFCALWKLTGGEYLTRKPENILEELAGIEEEYVFFADDESLLDAERMKTLAHLIKSEGIRKKYFLYGRSDTIVHNPDLLELWKEIGLERVFVGLEFFRDDDLRFIRKGSSIKQNENAVRLLNGLQIDIHPQFIVRPEFDISDFAFYKEYCLRHGFEFVGFSVLTPLPGTDFYNQMKTQLITSDYEFFDFFHTVLPTKLPLKSFYKELLNLYMHSSSFKKQMAYLRKFSFSQLLPLFKFYFRFTRQLKNIHKDYSHIINADNETGENVKPWAKHPTYKIQDNGNPS